MVVQTAAQWGNGKAVMLVVLRVVVWVGEWVALMALPVVGWRVGG